MRSFEELTALSGADWERDWMKARLETLSESEWIIDSEDMGMKFS